MDKTEFLKGLASLSAEERAAYGIGGATTAAAAPAGHKWAHLADAVPDADVPKVVNACRAAVKAAVDNADQADADPTGVAAVAPALTNAAISSARYRGKSIAWSLGRVCDYLQSETAAAKRAAAARRVPLEPRAQDAVKGGKS